MPVPTAAEVHPRFSPEFVPEHDDNAAVREAVVERWPENRFETCAARWQKVTGKFPEDMRALTIVPVSLGDESPFNIGRLLDCYGKQTMPPDQWGTLLSLNYTGDINEDNAMRVLDTIDAARSKHPSLNVASCVIEYDKPQPISRIRSDIWDVALFEIYAKQLIRDVIGISHDADTWEIPTDHVSTWAEIVRLAPLFCYGGFWGYGTVGTEDLPANKYVEFLNFLHELYTQLGYIQFEGNIALSMSKYAAADGWGDASVAEIKTLLENFNRMIDGQPTDTSVPDSMLRHYQVPQEDAIGIRASPRRIFHALQNTSNGFLSYDNFTASDNPERSTSLEALHEIARSSNIPLGKVREIAARLSRNAIGIFDPHDITEVHRLYRQLESKKRDIGIHEKAPLPYIP